jgi:hypothetical protein
MAYKLLDAAQERWHRFNSHELVTDVLASTKYKNKIQITDEENNDNEMTEKKLTAQRSLTTPPTTSDNCSLKGLVGWL